MTKKDITDIISIICPNDEDFEKAIISPAYLKKELEALALEQEPKAVLYSGDGYADGYMVYDMAECPNCGRKFEYGDETWNCNFCPDCGQALNWERSDKE